ncbi:MAG TPA: MBOAT family protein [Acidobacteriota bacterium]|nr:MBOAT family protein [Acidobacteriota bacterium]
MMEWVQDVFLYHADRPLLYTHLLFWVFFTVFYGFYLRLYNHLHLRSAYLAAISLFLYYKAGGYYFTLLIFSTLADYYLGHKIHSSQEKRRRKLFLTASVAINLGLLGYFKYTYFFTGLINDLTGAGLKSTNFLAVISNTLTGTEFDIHEIILPVGISFYTFQTISYTVDIYREKVRPVDSIIDFAFYVSYFPQLVAGPIVRAADFVPQIRQRFSLSRQEMGQAFFLIINGLTKKILISDYISINFVDRVFAEPLKYSGFENLLAVYGYAIQIYCDFSGYSDIAIGLALLMGFRLPLNFNSPYKALDITDFWRRWHISLSSWLRDYLYIPLGGNRKGRARTRLNLMITMLLGGLWHGADLKFVLWGGLHGLALGVHKVWMPLRRRMSRGQNQPVPGGSLPLPRLKWRSTRWTRLLAGALTFHFVCLCWIYFRAPTLSMAHTMMAQITSNFRFDLMGEVVVSYSKPLAVAALGFFFHWLPSGWKERYRLAFIGLPEPAKAALLAMALILLHQVKSAQVQPFIYFQF